MRSTKATALTLAEKCKNILASNWQAQLNTIKADAKGSKEDVYSSKAKYILKKGKPYIWVPEKDMHTLNIIIDERASLAISSPFPGPLAKLLRSVKRLPARVALTGDVRAIQDEKVWSYV
uniref:CREG-like beta-barrel domain-containing protein n=1 Tax=Rhizophora mucronata TaxID=61149 RepID=A0A2P2KA11_RHIMU